MAGSLGELVLKVSAPADRFNRDMKQNEGSVKSFQAQTDKVTSSLGGLKIGDMGRGFLAGLGIGSAIQGIMTVTNLVGDLAKTLAKAALEGRNVGDALDSWGSSFVGIKGIAAMFAEAEMRGKSIKQLGASMQRDIGRLRGISDMPGQGRVDEISQQLDALDVQRSALQKKINAGWNFGQTGDLKIELGNITGAMHQLELMKSQFVEDIIPAQKIKEARDEMEKLMQKGASLAESLRTPQQIFNASISDTLKLLEVGAINWTTYERAVRAAAETLRSATADKQKAEQFQAMPSVGAAQRGTAGGFSAVQSAIRTQQTAEAARAAKELAEQQRQTALLRDIKQALRRGESVRTPVAEI